MSPDTLKRAAAVLGVLVVLILAGAVLRGSRTDEIAALALPQLTVADVDRVVIERATDTLALEKSGTSWTVNGHEAGQTTVDELFTALADANAGSELVARAASSHERMGVSDATGRRFRFLRADDALAEFIVGKGADRGGGGYVRPSDEEAVYLVRSGLSRLADRDLSGWRERRIAAIPTEGIGAVEAVRTDGRYTLARADSGQWTIDGAPADSAAAMRVVGSLRDLQSAGFPTDVQERDSVDFVDPYRALTVRSIAGDTLLALIFDSTETGAWVRREGGPVYRMDRWRIDQLIPADSTLRAREPS